ncbi:class I SAM-dependent methyltransferase [Changchengzhania lutea]|uniref:class I SAM-dependent methyltransferase n=1 Tax=Changchengzhania lutea TaxID=2049305 RepID=UPI00163DA56F|nr:class I SAM-dependent methyltransferase [Changchengzhania lutea]
MTNTFSKKFEEQVIDAWGNRKDLSKIEKYLLPKYLTNNKLKVVEAGTASGIFSFYIEEQLGFKNIKAFDLIPKMIELAREKALAKKSKIDFVQADASNLNCFENNYFDYLVYLGQILCMVPKAYLSKSLNEAYRIGKKDSTYIFSFLDWNSRWFNPILSKVVNLVRFLNGIKTEKYYIPQVKTVDRSINWKFYKKEQHGILWIKKNAAIKLLKKTGFKIVKIYDEEELTHYRGVAFYIICKKV